jgi:WD40 repeat protein
VVSSDGKTLVTYDHPTSRYEGSLIIWDVETGKKQESIVEGDDSIEITSIALSPDGKLLAAALEDYSTKIWSVPSGILQSTLEDLRPRDGWYYLQEFSIAFSPDSQSLLMAGADSIGVWDVGKSTLVNSAKIKSQGYEDIALSPEGKSLAVIEGPNVNLMQLSDGSLDSSEELMQSNGSLAFSPDGSTLLVSMFDRTARLWPLNDQGSKKTFETDTKEYVRAIAFSPDGQMLAMEETYTGKVELRQAGDGALIWSKQIGTTSGFGSLGFSPDGKILAAALNDQIRLFQVDDGKPLMLLKGGFGVSFSPDGTMLAGGDSNKSLKVWNVSDGKVLFTIKDLPDDVLSTVFSQDGTLLVVGTWDGTAEIFRVSDGAQLKSWKAHSRGVADTLFSLDGKLLVTASWDGTIRVWGIKP